MTLSLSIEAVDDRVVVHASAAVPGEGNAEQCLRARTALWRRAGVGS
ncbi:hypothetical protein [Saccharothrix australiensis]|uniref:Uncharacterized protein n=1 Tax=Saccharothrix australiensis TaxID=2072 RepID=A0A495W0T4_9PSEU|nr:hypothetical protein [Saccharothrix australiensis]RKT55079.1 hypothetical protein C8E97_3735 [Saccharothrix australiensis]